MLSVFSIVLLVNTIVNTVLARFFFARLHWENREGPSRTYGWVDLCTASIAAEIPGFLACGVLYYVIWYWLSGLPAGDTAGNVFLSVLTFEIFEVCHIHNSLIETQLARPANQYTNILFGLFMIGISPDLGTAGNVLVFLVCSVNWFNVVVVPYERI